MKRTVCLDIHDPSLLHSGLDLLLQIKDHYPSFKVSLFWIPVDPQYETSQLRLRRDEAVKLLKDNLDWIQLIPHGLTHMPREFQNATYDDMQLYFQAVEEAFAKDGLPYEKGFCAPYWLWNEEVVRALDERGWWGAVDRNQPDMPTTKKYYRWSHSIHEPFWQTEDEVLKLHGHLDGTSENDLLKCFLNLFKLEPDTEFKFVTDFLKDKE